MFFYRNLYLQELICNTSGVAHVAQMLRRCYADVNEF